MLDNDDTRWVLSNVMQFWRGCPVKRCRRAKSCSGDSNLCHAIFWPVLAEELKVWWQAVIEARCANRTERQARRAADAADWRKREALIGRLQSK